MKVAYLMGSLNRGGTETLMLDLFSSIGLSEIDAICFYRKKGLLYSDFASTGIKMHSVKPRFRFDLWHIYRKSRLRLH